jgi:DNA-binding transcriptional MerR regulator
MNEGDESIPSTVTRKKRRGSGFRFSSKKDLERSKLKRTARAGGSELASVEKALSYPSTL